MHIRSTTIIYSNFIESDHRELLLDPLRSPVCTTDKRNDTSTTHQAQACIRVKDLSLSKPHAGFINCNEPFFSLAHWQRVYLSPSLWFILPTSCLYCYGPLACSMSLSLLNMGRRKTDARIFYNVGNGAIFRLTCYHFHFDLLTVCGRRKLDDTEKANYIKAVKCLQARPPLHQNIAAVRTRFDEFQALHIDVADRVHTTVNLRYCFH